MKNFFKEYEDNILAVLTGVLLVITLGMVWLVNNAVPFMMDDLWYAEKLVSNEGPSGIPITSLKDIIESQIWHFNHWGGRSITHGLLQILLQLGETAADILNVAAVLVLALVMCLVASSRQVRQAQKATVMNVAGKAMGIFWAVAMMIGLNANWQMSMFWQAGAANYLYITIFILLFLYCYLREDPDRRLWGISLWIVPLGLVSGWSNENMGPTVWILSLLVIFLRLYEKKKVYVWMILGNISCLAGSVLVVAAPGNFVRSGQAENEFGLLWNVFLRCYYESKAALEYLFPTLLLLVVVLVIGKGILNITIGIRNHLLMLGALLSWGAMILSPHYPDRATFGTMILLICVILSMMQKIGEKEKKYQWLMMAIAGIVWLHGMFFLGEYMAICWGWIK